MDYELHPLCTLFPRMSDADFQSLKNDIYTHGLRQPITLYQGMILDGGNRYKACLEIGMMPTFAQYEYDDIGAFVISANMHRRHMTAGQQAAIVASVANWAGAATHGATEGGRGNQHTDKVVSVTNNTYQTVADRAATSGASRFTQRKADAVARHSPDLAKDVGHGKISLNAATRQVAPQLLAKPATPAEFEYSETDQLRDQISELKSANEAQQIAIATATYTGEEVGLTDIVEQLREENKVLKIKLQAVESQRDVYIKENQDMKKQITYWRKQSEK